MDEEAHDPVRAGFDTDHEERERGEPPVTEHEKEDEQHADENRDHDAACERRAYPGEIDQPGCALAGKPVADPRVRGCNAADRENDLRQEKADRRGRDDEEHIPGEDCGEEDADWMSRADGGRKALRGPSGRRLEQRCAGRRSTARRGGLAEGRRLVRRLDTEMCDICSHRGRLPIDPAGQT